jgi:hypothetical protein
MLKHAVQMETEILTGNTGRWRRVLQYCLLRVYTHTHTHTHKYSNPELYAQAHADSSHKTQFSKRERVKKEKKTRGGAQMSYVV